MLCFFSRHWYPRLVYHQEKKRILSLCFWNVFKSECRWNEDGFDIDVEVNSKRPKLLLYDLFLCTFAYSLTGLSF